VAFTPEESNPVSATVGCGTQRVFSGPSLAQVAFPLGGIGTGTVSLGGRGELRDWEIFNRPAKGTRLPLTFFALWAKPAGREARAWVLERKILPPFISAQGLPPGQVAGLPRLGEAHFTGAYPLAHISYQDAALPVGVELEACNPFIPHNADDSGLPVAIFRWRLSNALPIAVEATVAFSLFNAIGYDGQFGLARGRRSAIFGGNLNQRIAEPGLAGIHMTRPGFSGPEEGSLAVASPWAQQAFLLHWERSGWFDDLQSFWDGFSQTGRLADAAAGTPSPMGETDVATLGLAAQIPPGGTVELPFILTWHFPNLMNYWHDFFRMGPQEAQSQRLGNYYATRFADAWGVARYVAGNLERLDRETHLYHDTIFASTLPPTVLDAVSSQSSVMRTTTGLRTEDGRYYAFEGCNDNAGSCPLNCTHVWNYEQTVAHLFPHIERSMRLTDLAVNTMPSGEQKFRTLLPLDPSRLWNYQPAADGQMGSVLKLYREWQISGDNEFLRQMWPHAQRALAYAWDYWDADHDGVMEGEQHNTYDVEFYGPNTMMGTLYLGALRAAEEMARTLGDAGAAEEYHRLYLSGREKMDNHLWNGEYYVQQVTPTRAVQSRRDRYQQRHPPPLRDGEPEPRYQFGPGCLSDQMLGQWFAHVVDLGYLLPKEHVRAALASIVRHNWRPSLANHTNCQRTYALDNEGGLLTCSWPKGGRPRYPFPYADEVWTGIEYQVAAHLIYEGLVEDGLAIVQATRARHDGIARNPWDEFECGHHYARAMSSWSLLLSLSGYHYSAPEQRLAFAPRLQPLDFRCFFSTGHGWGQYRQRGTANLMEYSYDVRYGSVAVRVLELALPERLSSPRLVVVGPAGALQAQVNIQNERDMTIFMDHVVTLGTGDVLTVHATCE
jgi:uncharacterized protein (DUF608 family)